MIEVIKKLFWVSRPVSWINTAYPFFVGYFLITKQFDLTLFIGSLFFLVPYNLMMYGVNDVYDYDSDIKNPRKGGVEGAVTEKAFHKTILYSVLILNVPFVIYLLVVGNLYASIVLTILIFFVVAYSLKGLRFKEIPLLDSVTSSIHFVGPLVYALVLTGGLDQAYFVVLAFFLWGIASQAFGAVQDIIPDREGGLRSIATELGAKKTVSLSLALYSAASFLILALGNWQSLIACIAGLLYAISVAEFYGVSDKNSEVTRKGWRRFLWLNYLVGFIITLLIIITQIS